MIKNSALKKSIESANSLYEARIVAPKTIRNFDILQIPIPPKLSPRKIKKIRLKEKLSQAIFAKYLNASESTIEKWETGQKRPTGPALKLLHLVAEKGINIFL